MKLKSSRPLLSTVTALFFLLCAARQFRAQEAKRPYPAMAPLEEYLMDRDAEVALARSAAPESISRDAEVLVLGRHGYETAAPGKNGFVCVVERSWTTQSDDPQFWNPKLRGPLCFNAAAARSYLPRTIKKTELVLAGRSNTQIAEAIKTAIEKKQLPAIEPGAMCYMLSKQGYLNDHVGHWHPHLMFFYQQTEAASWGADLPGSPILSAEAPEEHLTIFMVPVSKWSDGTVDSESKD